MPRGFLYLLPHFIIAIEVEHIGDKVKSILIVLYFGVQAGEVETVRQVFLIDLAKVLVSPRRYEPVSPVTCVVAVRLTIEIVHGLGADTEWVPLWALGC